jgi:hypothetical protein
MPSRPVASVAICLGDEIQDLSDDEQKQLRIEAELSKDSVVEQWENENEVSGPTP